MVAIDGQQPTDMVLSALMNAHVDERTFYC